MEQNPKLLIVDDEPGQRTLLGDFLKGVGYEIVTAPGGQEALDLLKDDPGRIRLVLTDLSMPGVGGVELIRQGRELRPDLDFVVITAHATVESAVGALRAGAADYLLKPLELDEVQFRVRKALALRETEARADRLERENRELRGSVTPVAESRAMKALLAELDRVAKTDATVLLTGETGVGKEVLARYLHDQGPRAREPFVAVNCSAIPENLVESEFFGFEKGAFTGADRRNAGFFERAHGGTLFLDEIGELDLKLQPKILRALEERKVRRVAGAADIPVNVRFVAATNRDLKELVAARKFREDLFYRLNVVPLRIPPLRERREEIPALVRQLVKRFSARLKVRVEKIEDDYLELLSGHSFPGNVRELANLVERSLIYQSGGKLTAAALPAELRDGGRVLDHPSPVSSGSPGVDASGGTLSEQLAAQERRLIEQCLAAEGRDVDKVAVRLDVARSTLYAKMTKYGLK